MRGVGDLVQPSCELRDVLLGDLDDLVQVGVVRPHRLSGGQRIKLPPAAFHPLVEFPAMVQSDGSGAAGLHHMLIGNVQWGV